MAISPSLRWLCRLVVAGLLSAAAARAEETTSLAPASVEETQSPEPASAETPPAYAWQLLAVDVSGVVAGVVLAANLDDGRRRPTDLGIVTATWYGIGTVGAPSVHFAHGQGSKGAASFGARSLIPPLAGVLGLVGNCLAHGDFYYECRRDGATGGTLLGLAGAALIDVTSLGRPRSSSAPERPWYGWQLLAMDGAALVGGAYFAAKAPRNDRGEKILPQLALWTPDFLVGLLGGPIMHFAHGQWSNGLWSLGARSLIGPLGALPGVFGVCAATAGKRDCADTGASFGLLGGLLLVDAFDAFVLGYEDVPAAKAAHDFAPQISVGPGYFALSGVLP